MKKNKSIDVYKRQGESSLYATYLPNEYFSRYDIYGKEMNLFANLNASLLKTTSNLTNRILLGVNFKTDGNLGDGKVYDLENPPYRVLSSENSSPRPRKYSSIPFINQLSLYAEENLSWRLNRRELIVQAGVRYDNINGKNAFTSEPSWLPGRRMWRCGSIPTARGTSTRGG